MAKYVHKCKLCGCEFESYYENTTFCSRVCYDTFRREYGKLKTLNCPVCGTKFRQTYLGHMFCSVECRIKSTEKKIECVCDYCGKLFERKESEVVKNHRHYCSNECKRKGMFWSDEDTEILIANFGKVSYKEMTSLFTSHKTVDEIKRRAIYTGLTSSREWTDDEITILIDNYSIKPMKEVMQLLPNRTRSSILGQARTQGIQSYFYLTHLYSNEEIEYLKSNYLTKSNDELGKELNRTVSGIAQRLLVLDLHRPTEINNYKNLVNYVRQRLVPWRDSIRQQCDYVCAITGKRSNVRVHHIRGFNLLFNETIEMLEFPIYEDISQYTQEQLDEFMDAFLDIQESYGQYICIREEVHKEFHKLYGYGNNTKEQWDDFIEKYYT